MFSYKKVKVGLVSTAIASLLVLASSPVAQASSYKTHYDDIPPRGGGNIEICNYDGGNGIISICRGSGTGRYNHWGYNGYSGGSSNQELGFEFDRDGGNGPRYHDGLGSHNTLGLGSVLGDSERAVIFR